MKNLKFIIASVLVLALLIGAYFFVMNLNKKTETSVEGGSTVDANPVITVADDSADKVVRFSYTKDSGTVSLSYSADSWSYPEDAAMPVDQDIASSIAAALTKVTATRDITGQGNESDYGFDAPTLTAEVTTLSGVKRQYTVGAKNSVSGGYYLKHDGKIYMIDAAFVNALSYSLFDCIAKGDLEAITADDILSLTVNGEEAVNKAGYADITLTGVENYKDQANYGFDGSENKVVVTYNIKSDITDENGNVTSTVTTETSYSFSYVESDGLYYVMLPDDVCVYSATGIDSLFTQPAEETDTDTATA